MRKGEESAAVEALHGGRVERLQGPEQRPQAEVSSAPSFRLTELQKMVPLSGTPFTTWSVEGSLRADST